MYGGGKAEGPRSVAMKKTTMTGIENLLNTTEEPPALSKEASEMYRQLRGEFDRASHLLGMAGRRPPKSVVDAQEVARSNLRAFERRFGLTPSDNRLS